MMKRLKGSRVYIEPNREKDGREDNLANETVPTKSDGIVEQLSTRVIGEILSRLPLKEILGCMQVCKPWFYHLKTPNFNKRYLERASIGPSFVVYLPELIYEKAYIHLIGGESAADMEKGAVKRLVIPINERLQRGRIPPWGKNIRLEENNLSITSCEGLFCFTALESNYPITISNPVTAQSMCIYQRVMDNTLVYSYFIGLGFSSKRNRYFLLRMAQRKPGDPELGDCSIPWGPEVFMVGLRPWIRVGDAPDHVEDFVYKVAQVIYVNGVIYWMYIYQKEHSLCSFNFNEESYQIVHMPDISSLVPCGNWWMKYVSLGTLGGCLCLSVISCYDGHLELWILKDNESEKSWTMQYHIETPTTKLEHKIPVSKRGLYQSVKFLANGDILMYHSRTSFVVYDPVRRTERFLRVLNNEICSPYKFHMVSHTPCPLDLMQYYQYVVHTEPWPTGIRCFRRYSFLEPIKAAQV